KIDMLIMGWHGKPPSYGFRLGSTVDAIIERSPCDVVILKECGNREFKRILVPSAGGPNCVFALEIASILAEKDDAEIVAFSVNTNKRNFDLDNFLEFQKNQSKINLDRVNTRSVFAQNIVNAILEESEKYDLVVIGSTQEPLLYQVTRDYIPNAVARRCLKPMIIVKASGGFRSWIKRWL
ncbi:universal stress protein, partial [Candidatus Latescibacterota bacterium]